MPAPPDAALRGQMMRIAGDIEGRRAVAPAATRSWLVPAGVVAAFLFFAIATLIAWYPGRDGVTGDEPGYLVLANSIFTYGSLEETKALQAEYTSKAIYPLRADTPDGKPPPGSMHTRLEANGSFSWHGAGVSIVLAIPYGVGGIIGAKVFLILIVALLPFFGWRFSGLLSADPGVRAWSVAAAFVALPFIIASNQIYPDMIGGVVCFIAIYGLMVADRRPSFGSRLAISTAVAFLPWLHVKFMAPTLILVAAGVYLARRRGLIAIACEILPLIVIIGLLAAYNKYAFGNPLGLRGMSELRFDLPALMVLAGLYLDQSQGFLMQNPIFLVGLWFLVAFCLRFRFAGPVSVLVFLSVIVPNAMEKDWYGGLSFVGRFGWAGACMLAFPTIHGLIRIGERWRTGFTALVAASAMLQIVFFAIYALPGSFLYNRDPKTPLGDYAIFYRPIRMWLPAFYDPTWAFFYLPNLIFPIIAWSVFFLGTRAAIRARKVSAHPAVRPDEPMPTPA